METPRTPATPAGASDRIEPAGDPSLERGFVALLRWLVAEGDMRGALLQAGLPPAYAEFLLMILGFFKLGYSERTTDAVQTLLGRAPITLEQYAADYRGAWTKAA